jgi:hypothetical protein
MNAFILAVVVIAFLVALRFVRLRRERNYIIEAVSQFIYRQTLEALIKDDPSESLQRDGLWIREHERDLVARYGSQWIAVVNMEVLATAATGEKAWDEAVAKHRSRAPFVKQLSLELINFEPKQS